MNVTIDRIQEKDFEGLISMFKEFAAFQKSSDKMINTVEKMREEKDFLHGFVLKDERGNLLGYVTFFFAYYTWKGKSLYMDDLYVREKYRGKGYGSALINEVIKVARKNKCYRVRWQVSKWVDPTINFYQNLGAEVDSVENICDLVL